MMSAILLPRISVAKAVRGFVIGSLLLPVLWIGMVSIGIGENPATAVLFAIALIAGGLHLWYLVKSARPLKVSQDLKGLTINLDLLTSLSEKLHSAEMTAKT
ncbi:MAG TPA: hypothetical protein VIJ46_02120, partial [Rhabdochlamydiaceae bacterium]